MVNIEGGDPQSVLLEDDGRRLSGRHREGARLQTEARGCREPRPVDRDPIGLVRPVRLVEPVDVIRVVVRQKYGTERSRLHPHAGAAARRIKATPIAPRLMKVAPAAAGSSATAMKARCVLVTHAS
jgi:hypothetical protein